MKKYIPLIILAGLFLSGCASVSSSGAQRVGQDEYTITARAGGMVLSGSENSGQARTKAISDANAFCAALGGYADVHRENIQRGEYATVIIHFRCKQ